MIASSLETKGFTNKHLKKTIGFWTSEDKLKAGSLVDRNLAIPSVKQEFERLVEQSLNMQNELLIVKQKRKKKKKKNLLVCDRKG